MWDVAELKLSGWVMKGVSLLFIMQIEKGNKEVEESGGGISRKGLS